MKVTIYDIAEKANVSIATVSKVINNKGRISEETRQKVKKVIEELNYQPNLFASALMGKKTKTVGLLIPDLVNPFFSELARRIEDRGHELDYNLVICNTDYNKEKEIKYLKLLSQKQVDGFILASGFEQLEQVEEIMAADIPVAFVARDFPTFTVNAVTLDDFMGGYLAAEHLVNLGHENIGVIARDLYSNRERLRGFKYKLEESNLQINSNFKFVNEIDHIKAGKKMMKHYMMENSPTAIFACNDLLAAGVIKYAQESNLRIPEDISVIGFDNTSIVEIINPPLTTIAQPTQEMGKEVMDLMVRLIEDNHMQQEKNRITLLPSLIKRKSTSKNNG